MKVRATAPGFYNRLYKAGETFDVPESFSASWVEPVDAEPKKKPGRKPKKPVDDVEEVEPVGEAEPTEEPEA